MFRKNYVPKLEIRQDFQTKKWFAYVPGDVFTRAAFVQMEDGTVTISRWYDPPQATRYETLDDLLQAIYTMAMQENLSDIKKRLTFGQVKISI